MLFVWKKVCTGIILNKLPMVNFRLLMVAYRELGAQCHLAQHGPCPSHTKSTPSCKFELPSFNTMAVHQAHTHTLYLKNINSVLSLPLWWCVCVCMHVCELTYVDLHEGFGEVVQGHGVDHKVLK